jgi:hypothetical protein
MLQLKAQKPSRNFLTILRNNIGQGKREVYTESQYCSALKSFPMQQKNCFVLNHVVKFIGATQDLLFLLTHCCVFCFSGLLGCFRMATLVDELQTVKLRNVGVCSFLGLQFFLGIWGGNGLCVLSRR